MRTFLATLHLIRLHQPAGIWLLLWPCWWSLTLAAEMTTQNWPDAKLLALFLIGAMAMRSAGCVINDLWDRKIDAQVERTQTRPLASGVLTPTHALITLAVLLLIALLVVVQLKWQVFGLALVALPLVLCYPLMKRITWWPQAFLGLTFNFGALMGWAAITGTVGTPAWLLYAAGTFWTLGYDTIYAQQDVADDTKIGVKSTARLFGNASKLWVSGFYCATIALLIAANLFAGAGPLAFLFLLPAIGHLLWQLWRFTPHDRTRCMTLFRSNALTGFLIWFAMLWA